METNLAPIPEPTIPADAWMNPISTEHSRINGFRITPADIERATAEFLASGRAVAEIPAGVSGETGSAFNNRVIAVSGSALYTQEEHSAHEKKRRERISSDDSPLVAILAVNLPAATCARDLYTICRCSADKLERLLRTYFAADETAKRFMRLSREEREAKIVREYPELIGKMSQPDCAKTLHVSLCELKRLVALHGLKSGATLEQRRWNNPGRPATAAEGAAA